MEYLTELFLPTSIWMHSAPGWLVALMKGITFLGSVEFYLLVMPAIYWCLDTVLGIRMGIILLISGGVNNLLKFCFRAPRPFWVSSQVQALVEETSFGFPSGHSQNSAAIWGLLASSAKRTWLKISAAALILLIGLSRIVLGVHFTHDVLGGWLAGLVLLALFLVLEKPVTGWFNRSSPAVKVLVLLAATSLFLIPAGLIIHPFNPPVVPSSWIENAGGLIDPYNFESTLTAAGSFLGLGLGVILLQPIGRFSTHDPLWKLVLRFLVGLAGVLLLYAGLGSVFPGGISMLAFVLRLLRYFLIGLWISYGAPRVFGWLDLAAFQPPTPA
jgi:membrane-associated phospholipid phosphatase